MKRLASVARRAAHRLRHPPIGYQQGRRARFVRLFPMVCWVYYGLVAHTTLRFFLLAAVAAGPLLLLVLVGVETRLLFLSFVVLAWMAAGMVIGAIWRPRLTVEVRMPLRVASHSRFDTHYTVTNPGRRCARDLAIDSLIFSDWMSLRRKRAYLDTLHPGETSILTAGGVALARGVYVLPALRYDSAFPGGFWRWGRTETHDRVLRVYPRYTPLSAFDMPLGNRHRQDLSTARDLAREALEFHGCREFREGDALRHVHPRSSARLGVPVIKEFQTEGRSRTALLVDTRMPRGWRRLRDSLRRQAPVEAALSLAAAVADALSRSDCVLELLVAGPRIYRFVSAGRVGYLEEVLDLLAAIEPDRADPLIRLEPLLMEEIRSIHSVCLILTGWDARRARLVREITASGAGLKVILVGGAALGVPPETCRLPVQAVLRGEVTQV